MKITIQVFIDSFEKFYTEGGYEQQRYWDMYGASLAIDNDITAFPGASFAKPPKPSNGYVVEGAKAKGYFWSVSVASFAQRENLKITKYPTILFFDVDSNKYVGKLEGAPHGAGEVAAILTKIFAQNSNSVTPSRATMTPTAKKAAGFGLFAFALLLLKPKHPLKK